MRYEIDEFLILYKVSKTVRLKDSKIFGAEIFCNEEETFEIDTPTPMFNSFNEYFEDFLELGNNSY